jgi:hypothetical protein
MRVTQAEFFFYSQLQTWYVIFTFIIGDELQNMQKRAAHRTVSEVAATPVWQ